MYHSCLPLIKLFWPPKLNDSTPKFVMMEPVCLCFNICLILLTMSSQLEFDLETEDPETNTKAENTLVIKTDQDRRYLPGSACALRLCCMGSIDWE